MLYIVQNGFFFSSSWTRSRRYSREGNKKEVNNFQILVDSGIFTKQIASLAVFVSRVASLSEFNSPEKLMLHGVKKWKKKGEEIMRRFYKSVNRKFDYRSNSPLSLYFHWLWLSNAFIKIISTRKSVYRCNEDSYVPSPSKRTADVTWIFINSVVILIFYQILNVKLLCRTDDLFFSCYKYRIRSHN